jgi:hypothetical protein
MLKITQQELKELLHYDPLTGVFIWKINRGGGVKAGEIAGSKAKVGYWSITLFNKGYYAHRLAWLYMTGKLPDKFIDHIDRNKLNNIWTNLREATEKESVHNTGLSKKNKSGVKGVYWNKNANKWQATLWIDNKPKYLGLFDSLNEAKIVIETTRQLYHKEFACNG